MANGRFVQRPRPHVPIELSALCAPRFLASAKNQPSPASRGLPYPWADMNAHDRSNKAASAILLVLAALLLGYVALRSALVSFSYDETYTYLEHVRKNVFFLREFDQMGGNHHLLNVWGMWLCERLLGDSEAALRLPSVLAFAGYLYAALRIAQGSVAPGLMVGGFLLLVMHPYLLDFFSLARGYAMGNAFLLLAIWSSVDHLRRGQRSVFLRACVFAALAALAHIIMINFLLAFAGAWTLLSLWQRDDVKLVRFRLGVLVVSTTPPVLLMLSNLFALHGAGSLNYGCEAFWSCSIATLMEQALYRLSSPIAPLRWAGVYAVSMALAVMMAIPRHRRTLTTEERTMALVVLMLVLNVLAFLVQHAWLDVPLPRTRTALNLLPLAAVLLVLSLQAWRPPGRWAGTFALVLALPLTVHSVRAANLTHSVEWYSTGELRKAVDLIEDIVQQRSSERGHLTVRTCFETAGCMGYYIHSRQLYALSHQQRSDTLFEPADLYLVEADSHHLVDSVHWRLVVHWDATRLALYRDARALGPFTHTVHSAAFTGGDHAGEVFPSLTWVVKDSLGAPPFLLSGHIDATEHGNTNWIGHIMQVWRNGRILSQLSVPSHLQTPTYGRPRRTGVELLFTGRLFPGDSVRYLAWPYVPSPPIELGIAVLEVRH